MAAKQVLMRQITENASVDGGVVVDGVLLLTEAAMTELPEKELSRATKPARLGLGT